MQNIEKVRSAIENYIRENGKEYDRLLVSEVFYYRLRKEVAPEETGDIPEENPGEVLGLPRLEIKSNADYDFKLM